MESPNIQGLHKESRPNIFQRFALNVIKSSHSLPKHYAFILDGNRRFAKLLKQSPTDGHRQGFDNMDRVSPACFHIVLIFIDALYEDIIIFSMPHR